MTKITVTLPPGQHRPSPAMRVVDARPAQYTAPAIAEHFDLDEACEQARVRVVEFINRSAGQHLRAMRERG